MYSPCENDRLSCGTPLAAGRKMYWKLATMVLSASALMVSGDADTRRRKARRYNAVATTDWWPYAHEAFTMKYLLVLLVAFACVVGPLPLSAEQGTATEFYDSYRAAWAKAKSFQDILSFHSKASQAQLAKIPADQQSMMFEMAKAMDPTDVKVVKETATPTGATLDLTGTDSEKKTVTGTAELVKEDGAWKMVKENWQL